MSVAAIIAQRNGAATGDSPATGPGPNEPASMVEVYDNPMSGDPHVTVPDPYGFYTFDAGGGETQADRMQHLENISVPASPPDYWSIVVAEGDPPEPLCRSQMGEDFPDNTGKWYLRIWLRFSADFVFTGTVTDVKFLSPRQFGTAHNHFFGFTDNGTKVGVWFVVQGVTQDAAWRSNNVNGETVTGDFSGFNKGQWYDVELVATPCTPGNTDGTLTIFVDGVQVWQVTNIQWCDAGQVNRLDNFFLDWIYSGYSGSPTMDAMNFDIANMYLSVEAS